MQLEGVFRFCESVKLKGFSPIKLVVSSSKVASSNPLEGSHPPEADLGALGNGGVLLLSRPK